MVALKTWGALNLDILNIMICYDPLDSDPPFPLLHLRILDLKRYLALGPDPAESESCHVQAGQILRTVLVWSQGGKKDRIGQYDYCL